MTVYLFRPLARQRKPRGLRIPILMYHSISAERENGHPYFWINTSPKRFAEHMKYLDSNNYEVISLSKAVEFIRSGGAILSNPSSIIPSFHRSTVPPRFVVLTFDDGYRDFYTYAFPVLRQYSFAATVFLPTDFIGNDKPGLCRKRHLNWKEVRELAGQGITFGSHTCTHLQLHKAGMEKLHDELTRSRFAIVREVGDCDEFCYPYKFPEHDIRFRSALSRSLESSGYGCCLTTRIGVDHKAEDLFALKRIPINSDDDLFFLDAKLNGAYNWLHGLQSLAKKIQ
jgi:peptidoglycan/xylan/chitin deacetylase (PgdA/CDA1 family)